MSNLKDEWDEKTVFNPTEEDTLDYYDGPLSFFSYRKSDGVRHLFWIKTDEKNEYSFFAYEAPVGEQHIEDFLNNRIDIRTYLTHKDCVIVALMRNGLTVTPLKKEDFDPEYLPQPGIMHSTSVPL